MNTEMIWKALQLSLTQNGEQVQNPVSFEYPEYIQYAEYSEYPKYSEYIQYAEYSEYPEYIQYAEYSEYPEYPEYAAISIQRVQQDERDPCLSGRPSYPVSSPFGGI